MKRLLTLTMLLSLFASVSLWAQTAVLVRNNQPIGAYSGINALINAVNSAEASGDLIILGSGSFNVPSEINKSVSIYGQGFEDSSTRTYLNGKLQYRSIGEGTLDNIHLEGLYISNHLNLLNDGNRSPINNLTIEKCFITGMFIYMNNDGTTIRNCVIQGDLKSYPGDYKATNMLIENCWKDGGSFNHFTTDSEITVKNSIFYCRSISGFDNSSAFIKANYENSVIASCSLAANSTATNCVFIGASTANATTTDCQTVSSVVEAFENVTTLGYSAGTVPTLKSDYPGIGITTGDYVWNTTPSHPTVNFETTLVKDNDGFYMIGTADDWVEFKRVVENIEPMANAKMTADIDLGDAQAMIGNGHYNTVDSRRAFGGIFDGQGHTLTIHFVTADILQLLINEGFTEPTYLGCGPFGYVCGGTIRNLHTAGTITSTHEGAAGLIGWTNGSVLIENCHSSVNIIFDNAPGKRGISGFTYNSFNDNHVLTIRDCVYDGTMTAGADKTGSAGFVIWRAYGTVNISNSLLTASYENELGTRDCGTFIRNGFGGGIISNSFYKTALGEAQGVQATETELSNGRTAFYLQAGREDLVWGQEIGVDPQPVLTNDESKRVYRSANGYTNDPSLAIANQDLVPLAYTRNSNNELTITGFDQGFTPPADYDLVIPNEIDGAPVVAIANSAFRSNTKIRSVTANSVTEVGEYAFETNSSLVSITMNEVLTLQRAAFDKCGALTTINMPKVETIADIVFGTASSLTEVSLPKAKTLGVEAFGTCGKLSKVSLPEATTLGNGVFLKGYALTHTGEDGLYIPNVTTIGTYLFRECTALTTVSMPNVTAIGTYTFDGCKALTSVDLPLITSIPERAFQNCTSLPAFNNPSITSIGHYAFVNCSSLTAYDNSSVTSLGNNVFEGCKNLVSANLPDVTSMGTGVFHQCAALDFDQVVLSRMTRIPDYTFQSCTGITNVILPNDNMPLVTAIGAYAFRYDSGITSVTINTAMTLGTESFRDCTNNLAINAPLVTVIPNHTFYNNNKLTTVNLPEVLTIGSNAFDYCRSLPTLSLPKVQSIGNYAFGTNSSLTEVSLPSCTTLATEVFGTCASLTKAYMPEVTTMGNRMFIYDTSLQTLGEEGIYLPKMTTIPPETFRECTNMVSAPLHSGITSIGNNAFYQDRNLESVTIPATVTSIGREAFRYCSSLNNVTLPGSLVLIDEWSFANCTSMENLTIEEGIPSISRDVFQFSGMKKVVLPSTLEFIGDNLFYQCPNLEELDFSKCVNVYGLYSKAEYIRTGANTSSNWNIIFGVPETTLVKMPPYAQVEAGTYIEVDKNCFDLQQDDEGFYLIHNAADWDKFVVYSRANPDINGRLTADIDLTSHPAKLGSGNDETYYITYQGTLDGQGHTLTINYKAGKDVSGGLFAYVENATIKNLKVEGYVTTNHRLIGGFVGLVKGTLTMQDCESAVDITVTPTTTNMHIAGFIGQGKQGTITLTDCLFTGSVTGNTSFRYAAPFLGWKESVGTITYNYCLNNGTFTNTDPGFTHALGATERTGQSTAAVCFYKPGNNNNNESLASAVSAEQLASGQITYRLQGGRTEQHWGQLLGRDPYPLLTNEEGTFVYRGQTYTNEYVEYAGLQKDEDDYYLIGGTADWEEFCLVVQDFPLSNARMTADVEVADNSMIGTSSMAYSGIFDGQGHALTVNYMASADNCAPFRYINGATIINLHTKGTINTAYRVAGGVAANLKGTNTIDQCWSSVSITSTYNGDVTNGGIVGYNENGTLDISNCLFDGSMTGANAYSWGGLVGWRAGTVNMTNCLFIPTSVNVNEYNCATLVRNGATINNCYYSQTINNNVQGTQVTAEQLSNGYATYKLQGKQDDLVWTQTLGTDEQPMLAVFATNGLRVYRTLEGYSNNPEEGALTQDAEGYYLIGSVDDWKMLAMLVDEGEYEAKARMTADIDLGDDQTMIGSGDNDDNHGAGNVIFQGTFDGQGHTLTIHYNVSQITVAPFRHIQNATIKNLHVAGTITTSNRHAGGIVGACYGEQIHSYITNCISSVNITSNYVNTGDFYGGAFTGGIAGRLYFYGQLHITDCIFDGSISGETRGVVWGGFLGLPDGTVTIENSLQIGTFDCSNVISGSNGSGTFSSLFGNGYASRVNVSNSYYLNQLGNAQGTQVTAEQLADGTITTALQGSRTEEIWVQNYDGQPILKLFDNSFIRGDVNGDGEVSITDVVTLVNKILNKEVDTFNMRAADLNGDNQITITDAVSLVNIILGRPQE